MTREDITQTFANAIAKVDQDMCSRDRAARYIEALEAMGCVVQAWQTVDRVPKGQTEVLLFSPEYADFPCERYATGWFEEVDEYHPNGGKWVQFSLEGEPTHWMPLPPAPKS